MSAGVQQHQPDVMARASAGSGVGVRTLGRDGGLGGGLWEEEFSAQFPLA